MNNEEEEGYNEEIQLKYDEEMKKTLKKFQTNQDWETGFSKMKKEIKLEYIYLAFLKVGAEESK